jgi:glucosamine-6-phosphate deaminase
MLPGGNTPLGLFRLVAARRLPLAHLNLFALDEYLDVPPDDPRTCANLIQRAAVEPWGVPADRYFRVSPVAAEAPASVRALERRIEQTGGLDVVVLGLGRNGHLGFNEPGSTEDAVGRVVDLDSVSVAANRAWFGGDYAPSRGATTGLKTILAGRRILVLAYGPHKSAAVRAAVRGPRTPACPASFLQGHPDTTLFLDRAAAGALEG